jgi:hypothetical protein
MSATRASRAKFVAAILLLTGMMTCPFSRDRPGGFQAFSCDHDAVFQLEGVTDEFRYISWTRILVAPSIGSPTMCQRSTRLKSRPECRPKQLLADMHRLRLSPVSFAALGVVDKDHSGVAKIRTVHDFSRPIGTSTNLGISIEHCSLPTARDAFRLLQTKWSLR